MVDALKDEDFELIEYGLENIVSPMSHYSDLWLYHPGVKNPQGEPVFILSFS